MKKMLLILIVTSLFGVAPFAAGGEVKDYSSTINVFKSSPAVDKFFKIPTDMLSIQQLARLAGSLAAHLVRAKFIAVER